MKSMSRVLGCIGLVLLAACSARPAAREVAADETVQAGEEARFVVSTRLASTTVARVVLEVRGGGLRSALSVELTRGSDVGTWSGSVAGIPVGTGYVAHLVATDQEGTRREADQTFDVEAGKNPVVTFNLQPTSEPGAFSKTFPAVASVSASSLSPHVGDAVYLKATPFGGSDVVVTWSAPTGCFSDATGTTTTFTPSAAGPVTLTATASGPDGTASGSFTLTLTVLEDTQTVSVDARWNASPVILDASLSENPIQLGKPTRFTVRATDDGGPVTLTRVTSRCAIDAATLQGLEAVIVWSPSVASGPCTIAFTVEDGEHARATGSIEALAVRDVPAPTVPPPPAACCRVSGWDGDSYQRPDELTCADSGSQAVDDAFCRALEDSACCRTGRGWGRRPFRWTPIDACSSDDQYDASDCQAPEAGTAKTAEQWASDGA